MLAHQSALALLQAHARLRASGFAITSVVSGRTALDARVWLGDWCRSQARTCVVAPVLDAAAALASYRSRLGSNSAIDAIPLQRLPLLLLNGPLRVTMPVAVAIAGKHPTVPVTLSAGVGEIVESLLAPEMPVELVSAALEGLVAIDSIEQRVLETVAHGRDVKPFLRGACEGLVYYMLQARAETRGQFEANARIQNGAGGRSHEVDLLHAEAKLVIEIDGVEHDQPQRQAMDVRKEADLAAQGYQVRRFRNEEVIKDPVGVWERIFDQLRWVGQKRLRAS